MIEPLTFMMGEFAAQIPTDRRYIKNHMWVSDIADNVVRFGLSAYAVRLLQDVYFIEFNIEEGADFESRQEIGMIESKKAESGIYAPCAGRLLAINPEVLSDPSVINVDKYGRGWLFEVAATKIDRLEPQQYIDHLDAAWEVAQRTIKGQANTE
jgi:glycine cleavage system H protein